MDKEHVIDVINAQKENALSGKLASVSCRKELLEKLYKNILKFESEIFDALKLDLNKCEVESYMSEIGIVLDEISFMKKHINSLAKRKRIKTPMSQFPAKSYSIPVAWGSVLVLSPWNYPFMLAIEPLVDAIAGGNAVVLKPSSNSPNVGKVIDKIIKETFSENECIVVLGSQNDSTFLLDQDFDYIFFTGSTRVGKMVMQKAAEHFIPVTLELGGKSPCFVDKSANIELAAKRIVFGKFLNCGQTCVAPDYILCDKSVKEKLIFELERQIVLQYGVTPTTNENYARMVNPKQFNATIKLIEDVRPDGRVVFGGKYDENKLKIEPTILDAKTSDLSMKQEIFGPVLPVVAYDSVDDAMKIVKSYTPPLALYVFSNDKKVTQKIVSGLKFGGGCINDTIMHIANNNFGFGGIRESGIGSYHGKKGFETFTHSKSIVKKSNWLDLPMRYQPFNKFKYFLIRKFLK